MEKNNIPCYDVPEEYGYPRELVFAASDAEQAVKAAAENLVVMNSTAAVRRKMSEAEVADLRGQYTAIVEGEKLEAENRLGALKADEASLKDRIKGQSEILSSINARIKDMVLTIKKGIVDETLDGKKSISLAVDGHYLHYTYTGEGRFVLAKVAPVPSSEQGDLFAGQTRNQEWFISTFGCQFTSSDRFEEVKIVNKGAVTVATYNKALTGRRLAADVIKTWTEDFTDEDTGEIVSVARREKLLCRDMALSESDILLIITEGVDSVVLYKEAEKDDAEAEA